MVTPLRIVHPEPDRHVLEEGGLSSGVRQPGGEVEDDLVVTGLQSAADQGSDPTVGIRACLGDQARGTVLAQAEERHREAHRRAARLKVEDMRADGRAGIRHCYPPRVDDLTIRVGDLHFTARWEAAAPRTREALQSWLPINSQLIHCKWSGESTWIPFGERRLEVGYENHTAHPAPGQLLIYTGDLSECEILFPYGACSFSSRVGPLAGNHFATLVADPGWDDRLRGVGRRVLWEGAQTIEISRGA